MLVLTSVVLPRLLARWAGPLSSQITASQVAMMAAICSILFSLFIFPWYSWKKSLKLQCLSSSFPVPFCSDINLMCFSFVRQAKDSRSISDFDVLWANFSAGPCQLMAISFSPGSFFISSLQFFSMLSSVDRVKLNNFPFLSQSLIYVGSSVIGRCLYFLWWFMFLSGKKSMCLKLNCSNFIRGCWT